jgi:large subunit ribosomal protein L21
MKYAVIEHGGKQYIAREGEAFEVDRMHLDTGKPVFFKDVLMVVDGKKVHIGKPHVSGASVKGKVEEHTKGRKILVFKYKPKERYRRRIGHRQQYTRVVIDSIATGAAKKKTETSAASDKAESKAKKPASKGAKSQSSTTAKKRTPTTTKSEKSSTAKSTTSSRSQASKGTTKSSTSKSSEKQDE